MSNHALIYSIEIFHEAICQDDYKNKTYGVGSHLFSVPYQEDPFKLFNDYVKEVYNNSSIIIGVKLFNEGHLVKAFIPSFEYYAHQASEEFLHGVKRYKWPD